MRHLAWLAGCLLLLSCTVNNDNLNSGTGGSDAGSGGAGGCPRCVGTGGATATGGQTGTGGAIATGGQTGSGGAIATGGQLGTGGQPGTGGQASGGQSGTGGSATGGQTGTGGGGTGGGKGTGGSGGETCAQLATDYSNAVTAAKKCTLDAANQCQQLVAGSLGGCGCDTYVNDATMINAIKTEWTSQGCATGPTCNIACVVPGPGVCNTDPTGSTPGGPGAAADPTGTCSNGTPTPVNAN